METTGFAITSLILGIASVIFGWMPMFGLVLPVLAIVFGVMALQDKKGKEYAIAGIILGSVGLVMFISMGMWFWGFGRMMCPWC